MYDYRRGATILIPLDAVRGDVSQVTAITAAMRRMNGASFVSGEAPIVLTVSPRAASGSEPAGWTLSLGPVASAGLALGIYRVEAKLVVGGGVIVTDPAEVRISEPVVGP